MADRNKIRKGFSLKTNRAIAYTVLVMITVVCLFWFYVLFINATRSHSELTRGFTALPSGNFGKNWKGLMEGTLPVWSGLLNSLLVSGLSAVLCTYFSAMTAYAIHVYEFKLKKFMFTFLNQRTMMKITINETYKKWRFKNATFYILFPFYPKLLLLFSDR